MLGIQLCYLTDQVQMHKYVCWNKVYTVSERYSVHSLIDEGVDISWYEEICFNYRIFISNIWTSRRLMYVELQRTHLENMRISSSDCPFPPLFCNVLWQWFQAIRLIEQTSENGWFAAHLTNLLHQCGCLTILENQQGSQTVRLVIFISEIMLRMLV
jgi:hypothetical protein